MSRPTSKLPRLVVLAAVVAGFDLADLFCYEITAASVLLISNKAGHSVRVSRVQAEAAARKVGPPPEDTRAQPAPGRAEAGPPDPPEGGKVPGPCDDSGK